MKIPFNKPYMTGKELWNIAQAHAAGHLAGDGSFTKLCNHWLENNTKAIKALITHSCTAALEMAAILADVQQGDEVIMPSFTFVSTANAFVLRGATPVFLDIRPDTLNIDESLIESAITNKTKAIVPVHYAGVSCEMDEILKVAKSHDLMVIEDAAQGLMAGYKGRSLGTLSNVGCISFHETKNIISGEGGALLVNDLSLLERAEIIREKGTNRSQFFRGQVDKYTWVDIGSSYLPGEIIAAFLWAQMEEAERLTDIRLKIWHNYHMLFKTLETEGKIRRPIIPAHCQHNAHMYYVLFNNLEDRQKAIEYLATKGISAVFHYVPLHNSPAGIKYGKVHGDMKNTLKTSDCILRMPLWIGLTEDQQEMIVEAVGESFE